MSAEDFEAVLSQIHDLIAPQEFQGGPRPISSDIRMIFIRLFIRKFELTFD